MPEGTEMHKRADIPEVLSPAGDMERLVMAVTYGADAVYLAGTDFGMRAGAGNFSDEELPEAVSFAHAHGVRVYVTCNTVPTDGEIALLPEFLEKVASSGADAIITADLGVMRLSRRYAPDTALHISTQAGVVNSASANAFYDLGAKRVILARELSLEAIRRIRESVPDDLELEAFCHGSMCVSFSGRCTLSDYLAGRDPNRGRCAQPCRWKYHLMAEERPGEYFEIGEEGGAYILNSRDMCMIDHVPDMIGAGVSSLKIEGRTKSAYYVSSATAAYRHAVDAALRGKPLSPVWSEEVEKLSHRPYSTGFYYGYPGQYTEEGSYFSRFDVVAMVESCAADGTAVLSQRNLFRPGDRLEILRPDGDPVAFTAGELRDAEGAPVDAANHPEMELHTVLPVCVPRYSYLRKPRTENLPGHHAG